MQMGLHAIGACTDDVLAEGPVPDTMTVIREIRRYAISNGVEGLDTPSTIVNEHPFWTISLLISSNRYSGAPGVNQSRASSMFLAKFLPKPQSSLNCGGCCITLSDEGEAMIDN
jgi:hypothetical protein